MSVFNQLHAVQPLPTIQPHYRVQPHDGRFAVAHPVPGSLCGELAAVCDFRTEQAAEMHCAWLNAGLPSFTPRRDPAIVELLAAARARRATA